MCRDLTLSELVAQTIIELLDEAGGTAEIQRNELAAMLGCVPSQINYVITSRFTPEQGYSVESRRGASGCIKITRVCLSNSRFIMHIINSIGQKLDLGSARSITNDILSRGIISEGAARLILAAISDLSLRECPAENKDGLRAAIFKNMLINAT